MADIVNLLIAVSCLIISVVASFSFIFTIIDDIMERKRHRTPKYKRISDMSIEQQRALYRNSYGEPRRESKKTKL